MQKYEQTTVSPSLCAPQAVNGDAFLLVTCRIVVSGEIRTYAISNLCVFLVFAEMHSVEVLHNQVLRISKDAKAAPKLTECLSVSLRGDFESDRKAFVLELASGEELLLDEDGEMLLETEVWKKPELEAV